MAYTIVWDAGLYLGSIEAHRIDNEHRNLKTSIEERMDDVLGSGMWGTDPVIDKTGYRLTLGAAALNALGSPDITILGNNYALPNATTTTTIPVFPVILPVGVTLTSFEIWVWEETSATVSIEIRTNNVQDSALTKLQFNTGLDNISPTGGAAAWEKVTITLDNSYTMVTDVSVGIQVSLTSNGSLSSSARVSGAIVVYDRANLNQVI